MEKPPLWDLRSFFPAFDGPEYRAFVAQLGTALDAALAKSTALAPLSSSSAAGWSEVVAAAEVLSARLGHVSSYVTCLSSADAENEAYQLAEAKLSTLRAALDKVSNEIKRGLGGGSDADFEAFIARKELDGAQFALKQTRHDAKFRMKADLESLASDIGLDGFVGWGRLYDVVASKMSFTMRYPDGRTEVTPMAQRRSLMSDGDRRVREAAFVEGNKAWEASSDVVSAALNHIAGTRHTLNARRGVAHVHDLALRDAAISRKTLDAMMEAVRDGAEIARRGLRLKARTMGLPAAAWFDLYAPLPLETTRRLDWNEGIELVRGSFGRSYPALRRFFDDALKKQWVEAEPRKGKRPGAYCTGSDVTDESRVFMTYQGSFGDVSTLAHEIGHAFHSHVMVGQRPLARQYPMTLAETASTFAENVLNDGRLTDPSTPREEQAMLLGEVAGDACAFLLDVPTRFFFETKFYDERKEGEVPASRLCALMAETQRELFGDSLVAGGEDPWFWASKLHFYVTDVAFYNFPYTFGYLVSRALFAEFKKHGEAFLPRYEEFLAKSGQGMAHEVAKATLGKDLETPAFWREAIETLREPLDRLESVLAV